MTKIKRAIISVSDKSGIQSFASELDKLGIEIISTGGTAKILKESGIRVKLISELTGFPEILDGRVKTLHPKVHGGLLGIRDNPSHLDQMRQNGIEPIDLVVVNLYPFEETISREQVSLAEAIENIDIGGPAMLRSAAKNYTFSAVVVNPGKYDIVLDELKNNGCTLSDAFRFRLAQEAFAHTAHYDLVVANYMANLTRPEKIAFPPEIAISFKKVQDLRYGENPHQKAALYSDLKSSQVSLVHAKQIHGKTLSFNNLLDLDSGCKLLLEFDQPCAVIIKHNNPCGAAVGKNLSEAFLRALETDPLSAFGGVLAFNQTVGKDLAIQINKGFVEAMIAPKYDEGALQEFSKKKNIMLLMEESLDLNVPKKEEALMDYKKILGALLVQESDRNELTKDMLKVVTERTPTQVEMESLLFAWKVAKHVKSNAIVIASGTETVGIGAGQMSRVDSVKLAIMKAKKNILGTVLASDAFFPFRDGVDAAAEVGVKALIQPGGSMRDEEVIGACNEHGMAMVFSGVRHFKH